MRLLLGFWLLATLSGTAALGTAADLTGKWSGTLSIAGENMPSYMSLMQDGPMIVGSMGHDETHQFPLRNVTVDQDTLAFEASTPKVTFSLSLKISEDSLKGTVKATHDGETRTGTATFNRDHPSWARKIKHASPFYVPARLRQ